MTASDARRSRENGSTSAGSLKGRMIITLEAIFEPPVCYIHAVESEA